MALSRSSLHLLCLVLCLAPAAAVPQVAATARQLSPIDAKEKISVDAASSDVDGKTNTIVFRDIVVSQGATHVRADHARATGLNFQNSRWTFQGNVQIDAPPRGSLRSDQATVEFRDNQIAGATITGSPAQFEQQRAGDLGMEKGHADQIVYDVSQGTVLLTEDAWISDGRNEMSAPSIAYSIRDQKVLATSSGASQGVHITITPQTAAKPGLPAEGKGAAVPPKATAKPRQPARPAGPGGMPAPPPPGAS
ncbi:MAG TPA: lipopolysaccharide transport periplasmic protein LptA [Steroidobacteraceae bacterium]|nr:lipopolysaccharide transport periplasmic protein LptA [Steroidobacteraceae bacterium]